MNVDRRRRREGSENLAGPTRGPAPNQLAFGGIMALCMCVTAIPTYALGTLAPFLSQEMSLSKAVLGSLTTALFVIGSVTSPWVGAAVDRFGGYRMLQVSFTTSIVALLGFAVAPTYLALILFIAIAGLARAISNPVTNTLIGVGGVPGRMGTLMGITKSGAQFSAIIAGVAMPPLAVVFGWRLAMGAVVCLAILGLIATPRVVVRDGPTRVGPGRGNDRTPLPASANWLAAYAFLMGAGISCINAYLPLFAYEKVGVSAAVAGTVMGVVGVISVPGRIVWARWSEAQTNYAFPLICLAAGSVLAVPVLMLAERLGPIALWCGAILFGASASSWISVGMLTIVRTSASGRSGRVSGRVLAGFYAGFVPSPILFGHLVDRTGDYVQSWLFILGSFVLAGALTVLWSRRFEGSSRGLATE